MSTSSQIVSGLLVLVCGGRDFFEQEEVFSVLDALHLIEPIGLILQGGAQGADLTAEEWAESRNIPFKREPALWRKHGRKAAGMIRNKMMLTQYDPDLVVAFPGGKGTANMVELAKNSNTDLIVFV